MNNARPSSSSASPPVALTIAGSDSSGGAGIQADLKTFQQYNVHGLSAVTSIVAETPNEVRQLEPVAIPLLQDQINILLESYPISAIKLGLLPSRRCIIAITESLKDSQIPLVIDPVMIASTGDLLMEETASSTLIERLLPLATLVTPNIPEAQFILQRKIANQEELTTAAQNIAQKHNTSCLIKGGHLQGDDTITDILWHNGKAHTFQHPTIVMTNPNKGIHGTGCTLSSAITAGITNGESLENAVESAITYVQKLIKNAHTWEHNGQSIQSLGW